MLGQAMAPSPGDAARERWRGWLGVVARWVALWLVAFVAALAVVALALHAAGSHLVALAGYLLLGGAVSLGLAAVALWLTADARGASVRVRVAVPVLLTALILSLNVLLVAREMFLSAADAWLVLAILIFGVLVAVPLAGSIAGAFAAAIQRIEQGARRMAAGDYAFRVPERDLGGGAELARLGHWFNLMSASVEDAFARQERAERERRQLVAAISHDLRTPLASVRAMSEAISDGVAGDPETVARYQRTILAEVRHLSLLIDDLFELARLEAGEPADLGLRHEVVALEDVISDALEALSEQAHAHGVALTGGVAGELPPVAVDVRQIHRVLTNLAQNALRHTPAGGRIHIHAQPDACGGRGGVMVRVVDGGEGIAAHDLPHIFESAYRGEASRQRDHADDGEAGAATSWARGAGLGLTIARGLVMAHGGHMWAESPLSHNAAALLCAEHGGEEDLCGGRGTCVSFTLPVGV
jgi:signal transduction histidine kinase